MKRHSSSSLLRKSLQSRAGLTLVEIMVVIAILGVLMTVLAVGVTGYLDDANASATEIQIKKLEGVLQTYAAKHRGKYPTTTEGLEAANKYFPDQRVPVDAWGNDFRYYSPGSSGGNEFEIISLGKDGAEGGEGAAADIKSWEIGLNDE